MNAKDLIAGIQINAHGFKTKVIFNSVTLGDIDNNSTLIKFFTQENENFNRATPDIQARNFILRNGENDLEISYQKIPGSTNILDVQFISLEPVYPQPLISIQITNKNEGIIKQKFLISEKIPSNFESIQITDNY